MAESEYPEGLIQYVPFSTFVHPSFWHALTNIKLNIDQLLESKKLINGYYSFREDIGAIFEVDGTSFNKSTSANTYMINVSGTILNKNTIEDFKNIDKTQLLRDFSDDFWKQLKLHHWIQNPNEILCFFILSFADLKRYKYFYWFAFPSPSHPLAYRGQKGTALSKLLSEEQVTSLHERHQALDHNQKAFFAIFVENGDVKVETLSTVLGDKQALICRLQDKNFYFAFTDPSTGDNPGWPLRNFLAALVEYCSDVRNIEMQIVAIRGSVSRNYQNSLVFTVIIPEDDKDVDGSGWVGWERNPKGNFGPKLADMSSSMDPVRLGEAAAQLNLQLMKWRLAPELQLEALRRARCLLLGAGTLGCHVARNLLAWGFRHITFVDNGKVSYSNPVRQPLYTHRDCLHGGRHKAPAAAAALHDILPTAESKGIVAHIPMPGHPVGDALKEETLRDVAVLTECMEQHDVVFLLLDTREARWLPTLLAHHLRKIVINAALGFDSYLVMRHGASAASPSATPSAPAAGDSASSAGAGAAPADSCLAGADLGCYFCNDVTAPGNSVRERTLDQQCTVTRPGAAAVAGALAVELLVALLHHPLREGAPATYRRGDATLGCGGAGEVGAAGAGVLGAVPHSLRGCLYTHALLAPTAPRFPQCVACSTHVLHRYREEGVEFLLKVFNDAHHLELVTGLTDMHLAADLVDVLALSDDAEDSSDES